MSVVDEKLVFEAAGGDQDSLDRLAIEARPEIKAFLFRTTLNEDLADDLTQETLLQVISSLGELRNPQSFWPWVLRIAVNKMNQHYRVTRQETTSLPRIEQHIAEQVGDFEQSFGSNLDRKDLSLRIVNALKKLKEKHRAVISMRCLDDMPYKHIAEAMNCSQLHARVTFVRAKKHLKKELIRQGVKTAPLIVVITLFGRSTVESSKAASVTVGSASMEASGLAHTVAAVTTKKAAVIAAGAILTAAFIANLPEDSVVYRKGVNSVHFVVQARNEESRWGSLSSGAYEKWCYFPEGVEGPMILRMQRWDPAMRQKLCGWLQDENGNYYYNTGNNTVYVLNERLGGFLEMPTDTVQMASFIAQQQPKLKDVKDERDSRSGLLVSRTDNRFKDAPDFHAVYEYNHADPCGFRPFWPADANMKDLRTPMHRRGWTCFNVSGNFYKQKITGNGCIPFVLSASHSHPAWIRIKIGEGCELVDTRIAAWIDRGRGNIRTLPAGTFLNGLCRPWSGYSALDVIRRDAAAAGIAFQTFFNEDMSWAQVALTVPNGSRQTSVIYEVDLLMDVVKSININSGGDKESESINLVFNYLENMPDLQRDFSEPALPRTAGASSGGTINHWLADLAASKILGDVN
jgi:RNA polymerase sigma factor (sigma-70 family)